VLLIKDWLPAWLLYLENKEKIFNISFLTINLKFAWRIINEP
jgi:hypothetical protein